MAARPHPPVDARLRVGARTYVSPMYVSASRTAAMAANLI